MTKTYNDSKKKPSSADGIDKRIESINRKRKKANSVFKKLDSKVYKAFLEMEKATFIDGTLSVKTKELIAVSISVVTNCESCMQWHIEQARNKGATAGEILEAIEVAIEMGAGPVTVNARFALEIMESYYGRF